MIKHWLIAIVVLAIIVWGFAGMPALELKAKSIEILKSIFNGLFHRLGLRLYSSWRRLASWFT